MTHVLIAVAYGLLIWLLLALVAVFVWARIRRPPSLRAQAADDWRCTHCGKLKSDLLAGREGCLYSPCPMVPVYSGQVAPGDAGWRCSSCKQSYGACVAVGACGNAPMERAGWRCSSCKQSYGACVAVGACGNAPMEPKPLA